MISNLIYKKKGTIWAQTTYIGHVQELQQQSPGPKTMVLQ